MRLLPRVIYVLIEKIVGRLPAMLTRTYIISHPVTTSFLTTTIHRLNLKSSFGKAAFSIDVMELHLCVLATSTL